MGANGTNNDYYVLLEFFKNHTSITFGWMWFKISSKDIEKDKTINIYGHLYKKYGLKPFEEIEYLCARLYYRTKISIYSQNVYKWQDFNIDDNAIIWDRKNNRTFYFPEEKNKIKFYQEISERVL